MTTATTATTQSTEHLTAAITALERFTSSLAATAEWGAELERLFASGGRLLAAGNGGSAAQAQHLTAELVGRFDGERGAYSAISLHAETSAFSAISNDYGYEQSFARQVRAHGRPGDVLLLLSTSGRSPNLLQAAQAARQAGLATWALVGQGPTRLSDLCDESVEIQGPSASVQECHLVAIHAICRVFDAAIAAHEREASKGAWQ